MVELVKDLQQLNKVTPEILQADIKEVVKNPEQYALDFAEIIFTRHFSRYIKAYKLGEDFAKRNMKMKSKIND